MTRRPHVVVVGDVMLDRDVDGTVERLSPDGPAPVLDVTGIRESPGGAGLAALLCAGSGARVTLVAPVAVDEAGHRLTAGLTGRVDLLALPHQGATRTKTRVRSQAQSLVRVDDGGPGTPGAVPVDDVAAVLAQADAVLVSDYGAGTTHDEHLRTLLTRAAATGVLVWDPHPRGGAPVPGATLVTPNLSEAAGALRGRPEASAPADVRASALLDVWSARGVAVTAGADGAFVATGRDVRYVPAPAASGGDPCGAGDRFAASAVVALAAGATVTDAVTAAVLDASEWVEAGGAEAFRRSHARPRSSSADEAADTEAPEVASDGAAASPARLRQTAATLRAGGRTLVATGGCFDIVHAGHVATLQAARRLGDSLVVLMNSDDSVRRLKGPGRPVVTAADRARVLAALDCVDAVLVFDEDDPRAALEHLRPDVWVKGGDYDERLLPEADVVQRHGGRIVLLPYLDGRSTTSILRRSATRPEEAHPMKETA
ncbi:Bifunctional protein HldE [Cellulomonas sp. T2.31MG-18]|uniref:PfkB family carbohydrate kinase n=1 Tax=Cellulomonas sp. T2.31MG-18 TaxID=3157619 RepID=UPI0035E4906E